MPRKYTYEEVKQSFEERGYILLSKEYINCSQKLEYICSKHKNNGVQKITFGKFKNGQGCYYCGREKTENAHRKNVATDFKDIESRCKELDFTFIKIIKENKIYYVEFVCNKHADKGIQKMRVGNIRRDIKGCKYCANKDQDYTQIEKTLKEKAPHLQLQEHITHLNKSLLFHCTKHNRDTHLTARDVLIHGMGCYECGIEKLSKIKTKSHDTFVSEVKKINPHFLIIGNYLNRKTPVKCKCLKCGHEWESPVYYLLRKHEGCPDCKKYTGEAVVEKFLIDCGINYISQYKFDNCKNKRCLPFDFYLPYYNTCIEYDGIQHYEPKQIARKMSKEVAYKSYIQTKHNDLIKNEYCKKHCILLIRIPYWELEDENIEYYLFDKFVELNILEKVG